MCESIVEHRISDRWD